MASFARTVHDATHHRHLDRHVERGERDLGLVGDLDDVDFGPPATRTGNEVESLALTQAQHLE